MPFILFSEGVIVPCLNFLGLKIFPDLSEIQGFRGNSSLWSFNKAKDICNLISSHWTHFVGSGKRDKEVDQVSPWRLSGSSRAGRGSSARLRISG